MKKWIALVLALAAALALAACGGNTASVKRTVGESEHYSAREISAAMDVVESHFRRYFDGCTLLELAYDEAVSDKASGEWAEQYSADRAIVLTSSFHVDDAGDGSLNPNYTYNRWQWVLTRSGIGGWKLQTWGY